MTSGIVFHLPRSWLGPLGSGLMPFYANLDKGLRGRGVDVSHVALDRDRVMQRVEDDPRFHIVNHGRFSHPRALNAGIAYIYPFWTLDPLGIRAFSSVGTARFEAGQVDGSVARPFYRRLRQRLVGRRTSRYQQPLAPTKGMPQAGAAVFLQSEGHRVVGETCHLTRWQMLETVLAAVDAPVIVKPHPRDDSDETRERLRDYAARHPRLHVSQGNIHDIIAASERVVTINSAVGVEAYLHRKPVTLCGQADFHHIAQTARTPAELARFLTGPVRKRAYDKYVYWYFGLNCLDATDPRLVPRFLERVAQGGAGGSD